MTDDLTRGIDRRRFLSVTAAAGLAGTAVVLDPVAFPAAAAGTEETRVVTGRFEVGAPDWVYVPVRVPRGVREIAVRYTYDRSPGNALDIGIFDQDGYRLGDASGFRGWSGGFRDSFAISRSAATPGYLPGPVEAGTWHVIRGPSPTAPLGLDTPVVDPPRSGAPGPAFGPAGAPTRAAGRGRAWYRGDLHLHTVHSDGARLPGEVAAAARAAGLDFFVSTEHNTSSASGVWGAYAGPDLLIVDGEEITTRNGHYLAAGLPAGAWIDWRYRATDGSFRRFADQIHRLGGLVIGAHPYCPFVGCSWKFGTDGLDTIEVWNGPWTLDDEVSVADWDSLLVAGRRWLPAVGSSDAHREPQVVGLPRTVVLADDLDKRSILAGVRAGRSWIAESGAVDLTFEVTGAGRTAGIGGRLRVPDDTPVTASLTVTGAPGTVARLVTDEGKVLEQPISGPVTWRTTPRVSAYVRAEVRRPDGSMVALTNPVFLGVGAGRAG